MTLDELIRNIEAQGYTLTGSVGALGTGAVITVPLVLVPKEPPVKEDCMFVQHVLTWGSYMVEGWAALAGFARIEGAATTTDAAVVHLQFVRKT